MVQSMNWPDMGTSERPAALITTVQDGRAVQVQGTPAHVPTAGVLCAKVSRYAERTNHPERLLQPLRARAQYVIDTSLLSTAQNKERVCSLFLDHGESPMALTVVSFGFKYGLPQEADLVLDVRCLPNPFYVPELKNLTGLDQEVVDYVMAAPESQELLRRYESMLEYALPLYVKEGKSQLMIAVGCTGGKHRSITFARKIGEFCEKLGYEPSVQHRDAKRTL